MESKSYRMGMVVLSLWFLSLQKPTVAGESEILVRQLYMYTLSDTAEIGSHVNVRSLYTLRPSCKKNN